MTTNFNLPVHAKGPDVLVDGPVLYKTRDGWDNGTVFLGPIITAGAESGPNAVYEWKFRTQVGGGTHKYCCTCCIFSFFHTYCAFSFASFVSFVRACVRSSFTMICFVLPARHTTPYHTTPHRSLGWLVDVSEPIPVLQSVGTVLLTCVCVRVLPCMHLGVGVLVNQRTCNCIARAHRTMHRLALPSQLASPASSRT